MPARSTHIIDIPDLERWLTDGKMAATGSRSTPLR